MRYVPIGWRIAAVLLFLLPLFAVQLAYAGATPWEDIQVVDGFLVLETEIDGIAGLSIVDTGAQLSAINSRFLAAHDLDYKNGRPVRMAGVFSESRRSTYLSIPGSIFGAPINFKNMVDMDVGSPDIQLLLGANFLAGYIFQFDYPNERLRLITRDSVDLKTIRNVESRKERGGGAPLIRVNLDGKKKAWLLMDTGATGGILIERDLARKLDWIGTYPSVDSTMSGVISSGNMEHFKVPSVQVGPFRIENVLVSTPAAGESPKYFEKYTPLGTRIPQKNQSDGILGYDVLQHFIVTIDYEAGYIHFYPGEKAPGESADSD